MIIWIAIGIGSLILGLALGFVISHLHFGPNSKKVTKEDLNTSYESLVKEDVYHIFDEKFHDELRKKAEAIFQSVIDENTATLKDQLVITTKSIDDRLQAEIGDKLKTSFGAYTDAVTNAQQEALATIKAAVDTAVQQQAQFSGQVQQEVEAKKAALIDGFQQNMAQIVNHYVLQAIGEQIDLKSQMPLILSELSSQQEAMQKDMRL